jgi:O-antigen/teichoic acid export membrane protein
MNTTRYVLALFLVIALPPLFLYWLLIHPFISFWRGSASARPTRYFSVIVAAMIGLFSLRHFCLAASTMGRATCLPRWAWRC